MHWGILACHGALFFFPPGLIMPLLKRVECKSVGSWKENFCLNVFHNPSSVRINKVERHQHAGAWHHVKSCSTVSWLGVGDWSEHWMITPVWLRSLTINWRECLWDALDHKSRRRRGSHRRIMNTITDSQSLWHFLEIPVHYWMIEIFPWVNLGTVTTWLKANRAIFDIQSIFS